ncbi:PASTA domain-containing protein [Micromonospora sp. DT229]|uniref:PASTA domain-containing protein n=1 Tax=Micromonospora sp. DT229 TaxID=3393430 RepID=UPI003CEF0F6C
MTGDDTQGRPEQTDAHSDRTTLVIGGGLVTVLLVVIGAAVGWGLAGDRQRTTTPPLVAEASHSPTTPEPGAPTPDEQPPVTSAPTTAGAPSPTGLTVPDLVGMDFVNARDEVRVLGLSWKFVFGSGDDARVSSTDPEAGSPVKLGAVVVINVIGAPPPTEVPNVMGKDCRAAAADLLRYGFDPRHPAGVDGTVNAQEPAGGTLGRWNDEVRLLCGTQEESPDSQ